MPLTGRTHQLRVHCAFMGHPIVGDAKYAGEGFRADYLKFGRDLHLHARALRMPLRPAKCWKFMRRCPKKWRTVLIFWDFPIKNRKIRLKNFL